MTFFRLKIYRGILIAVKVGFFVLVTGFAV